MEYTITEGYDKEANLLRKKLIIGCLGRNVDVDVFKSIDNTFTRFHISDENVSSFESKSIQHILQHIKSPHRYLCSDREEAVIHMMKMNPAYSVIKNMWNVFYYDSTKLTPEMQEFAEEFVSQIKTNIVSVPTGRNEIENILNLE